VAAFVSPDILGRLALGNRPIEPAVELHDRRALLKGVQAV
jgi:hypothetical protein